MANVMRSARGEIVDFDLLKLQHDIANTPQLPAKNKTVLPRTENFIADRQNAAKVAAASKEALIAAMQDEANKPQQPVAQEPKRIIKREPKNA